MSIYPKAIWKPINHNYTKTKTAKTRLILHTTASGKATSVHEYFNKPTSRSSSHFHIAFDGTVEQYVDTEYISWASGEGNHDSISIETQGYGTEAWSEQQVAAIIDIIVWANKTHQLPITQMDSSRAGTKGIGWHRLGVDGKWFPDSPSILAGRTQRGGGEKWSSATGKTCPGDLRIHQIPGIISKAKIRATTQTAIDTNQAAATYTVRDRDSWWSISRSLDMDMHALASLNGKTIKDTLYTGQVLKTATKGTTYTVNTEGLNRRTKPDHTSTTYGTPLYKGALWHGTGKTHKDSYGNTWVEGHSDWMLAANQDPAWVNDRYLTPTS